MHLTNPEVLNRLRNAGPLFEQAATAFLRKGGLVIESVAKQHAPRDRGILGNSIRAGDVAKHGGTLEIAVGTNVEYAPHHEFGTGIYGPRKAMITPRRAKRLVFTTRSGQLVFARAVRGVKKIGYLKKGVDTLDQNPGIAMAEADKVIQRGL